MNQVLAHSFCHDYKVLQNSQTYLVLIKIYSLQLPGTSPEFKAEFDCSLTKNDCSKCL